MNLEHANLRKTDEALGGVQGQVLLNRSILLIGNRNAANAWRKPHSYVLLKETRLADALRTANNGEWPVGYMRQHVFGDGEVVICQRQLCHPGFVVENFIRVGNWQVCPRDLASNRFWG